MSSDLKIYRKHTRQLGLCRKGQIKFALAQIPDFDWNDFLNNGIAVSRVEHIDDVMVQKVIAEARREANGR